jgi:Cytochrome c7 and related cytochrome c
MEELYRASFTDSSKMGLWTIVLFCCLCIGGCRTETPTGIRFSHNQHLGRGYTCALCHQFLSEYEPARPPERVCAFCHEIGTREEPGLACAICHTRPDFTSQGVERPTFEDNRFKHERHEKARIACLACHRGQDKAKLYEDIVFPSMTDCMDCHSAKKVAADCQTCHRVWRQNKKPENHNIDWQRIHGAIAVEKFETNCDYCHSEKVFCLDCHMTTPPRSHTLFFKNRGHGFWAETDRMGCLPCHKQDFCLECHGPGSDVKPVTHKGGFGGRRPYLHCASCHFPTGEAYGCKACHNPSAIQTRHLEATEERSSPIPSFVPETSLNCLNGCHPFELVRPFHPIGALNNNDCLRCHTL